MSHRAKSSNVLAKLLAPFRSKDITELAAEAAEALGAARHKEAAELYKELVKRERRPEWVDSLALCYASRADSLAAKGMIKEALVLWRNRSELCGKPLVEGPYLNWLMQVGEQRELFRLLSVENLPDAVIVDLGTRLAAAVLVAPDSDLRPIPHDNPLVLHRAYIKAAWTAYHRGDFPAMEEKLQAIPFRSPYRDLKSILKALVLLETQAETAPAAIARLPVGGPFERIAAVVRAAAWPDSRWMEAMYDLDEEARLWVLDIKGCPDTLRPLLLDLIKLGKSPPVVPHFDLFLRNKRVLPAGVAARFCRQMLPHIAARMPNYTHAFGKLPEEEHAHVFALAAELQRDHRAAHQHWAHMAYILGKEPARKQDAAMIWRNLVNNERSGAPDEVVIDCLSKSVELDPYDLNSQLRLIRTLRTGGDLKKARVFLDKALSHFPNETGLLLEAVEAALAGKTFKKAVGLAKQVLALDPINPQVRVLIGHAHFSQARKQIKAGKYVAAHKELAAAAEWLRAPEDQATRKLLSAIAVESEAGGDQTPLREEIAELGGSLVGGLHLLLEVGRIGFNRASWLKRSGIDLSEAVTSEDVILLARTLTSAQDPEKSLRAALDPLRAPLKRAANEKLSESDHRLVCEAFLRVKQNDLLYAYAESALKRWPGSPAFVYFKVFANHGNAPFLIPMKDQNALEQAARTARDQHDLRTEQRIRDLLTPSLDHMAFDDDDDEDAFDGIPDDQLAFIELIAATGGEEAFIDLVRKTLGERLFLDIKKQARGNKKQLMHLLIEFMAALESPPPSHRSSPKPKQRDRFDD